MALLVNNPFLTDARSWKMASTLAAAGYRVTVVARAEDGLPARASQDGFDVLRIAQPDPLARLPRVRLPADEDGGQVSPGRSGRLGRGLVSLGTGLLRGTVGRAAQAARYMLLTRQWARAIASQLPHADVWQGEQLIMLPVALELRRRRGGLVVYDAHDLDTHAGRFARLPAVWRRLLARSERRWARAADAVISANGGYAEEQARAWGRVPAVIWNGAPDFQPPDPPERRWHGRLGLAPGIRVVLYLGLVMRGRGIAELARAMAHVPDAVLIVAGFGPDYERYRDDAASLPHGERIAFPGSVPHDEILPLVAAADVAAMPVQGDTLNHRLNVPTKLFDAMAAGVPVVASDLPGMGPIVRATGCGTLCDPDDPLDIARATRWILDASPQQRAAYRAACLEASQGTYGWARQAVTLRELYADLLSER